MDDAIARIETDLAETLAAIRSRPPEEPVDPCTAAAVVSHMLVRTEHFRTTLHDGIARALERFKTLFAEAASIERMVGVDTDQPTPRFREMVTEEVARSPEIASLSIPERLLERAAFAVLKETSVGLPWRVGELVAAMVDEVRPRLAELVRESHNKGLDQAFGSSAYKTRLRTFEWSLHRAPESGAILPDSVVIAFGEDGQASTPLLVGGNELRCVVMAVSPERLLVGRGPGFELPASFDYNTEAARLSDSFFLASRNDAETARLHSMIGARFKPALEAAIEAALEGVLPGEGGNGPRLSAPEATPFEWRPSTLPSLEDCTVACSDRATDEMIQTELADLVTDMGKGIPLERLDGITAGSDYPALLRGVDRGFKDALPVGTVPSDLGVGIAKLVTVKRSGVVKGRVIISDAVCEALISDDAEETRWACSILATMLARVALIAVVDETLPGRLLSPVEDGIEGWLYSTVDGSPESYLASRMAAGLRDSSRVRAGLRDSLVASLDRLRSVADEKRLAEATHGDLDKILGDMLPAVGHVLASAAGLLGHCSSRDESPHDSSGKLEEALDKLGLTHWFKAYEGNLERFHGRLERWESFDEFLAFNLHVERLMWAVGVFAWEDREGLRCMVASAWDSRALQPGRYLP